jgi:hypothetical protein
MTLVVEEIEESAAKRTFEAPKTMKVRFLGIAAPEAINRSPLIKV